MNMKFIYSLSFGLLTTLSFLPSSSSFLMSYSLASEETQEQEEVKTKTFAFTRPQNINFSKGVPSNLQFKFGSLYFSSLHTICSLDSLDEENAEEEEATKPKTHAQAKTQNCQCTTRVQDQFRTIVDNEAVYQRNLIRWGENRGNLPSESLRCFVITHEEKPEQPIGYVNLGVSTLTDAKNNLFLEGGFKFLPGTSFETKVDSLKAVYVHYADLVVRKQYRNAPGLIYTISGADLEGINCLTSAGLNRFNPYQFKSHTDDLYINDCIQHQQETLGSEARFSVTKMSELIDSIMGNTTIGNKNQAIRDQINAPMIREGQRYNTSFHYRLFPHNL